MKPVYLGFQKKIKMKKLYVLVAVIMASFVTFASVAETSVAIENIAKEGVDVTIAVNSGGETVKGALVKIVAQRMVIGAGTTDESGNVTINIASYGNQLVTIEVYHSLYKSQKLNGIKLETGKTYSFSLIGKGETVTEITEESEVRVVKTQEETEQEKKEAEEAIARKEEAIKRQEELRKETEELAAKGEEASKEAEEAKKRTEEAKEEEVERDISDVEIEGKGKEEEETEEEGGEDK